MKGSATTTQTNFAMTMRSQPIEAVGEDTSAPSFVLPSSPLCRGSIGWPQMATAYVHHPVLEREVVELFTGLKTGVIIDATLGGGGHAAALLTADPNNTLLGIDRDPAARRAATARLEPFGNRVTIVDGEFANMADFLTPQSDVVGILMDLGVSSPQLDDADRGFSFRADAPLDMRMDSTRGITASELVASIDQHSLARLLRQHGEQRFAGAIAKSIIERRPETTNSLVEAVERAVPMAARRRGHVATRVFQALRVEVNDEEGQLQRGLSAAIEFLAPGGILVVISYHSGEDQVVKSVLREAATGGCSCPVALGCVCGAQPSMVVKKFGAVMATGEEVVLNPRARSARLRYGWKVSP